MELTRISELEELCDKATPLGEVCPEKLYLFAEDGSGPVMQVRGHGGGDLAQCEANHDFYYAARSALPECLKEIRQLKVDLQASGIYCSRCNSCGDSGCCPAHKCAYVETYQNEKLEKLKASLAVIAKHAASYHADDCASYKHALCNCIVTLIKQTIHEEKL